MSDHLAAQPGARPVFRIGRPENPWVWPPVRIGGGSRGGRWDDPEEQYRVLYASSQRLGAFMETLAPLRPDLVASAAVSKIGGPRDALAAGTVPREWLANRRIGSADLLGMYADVGAAVSLHVLRDALGRVAHDLGLDEIDVAALRQSNERRFTQAVSRFVSLTKGDGDSHFAGIVYLSKLGDEIVNWAIFEPGDVGSARIENGSGANIQETDGDLAQAFALLGLRFG